MRFTGCRRGLAINSRVGMTVAVGLLCWGLPPSPVAAQPPPGTAKEKEKDQGAPKQPPEPAWKAALVRDYGLKADEVLRRVAAPLPPSREAFLQSLKPKLFPDSDLDEVVANYRWDGKTLDLGSVGFRPDKQVGWPLMAVLSDLGIPRQDVEGDEEVRRQQIDGEFVVRAGAPADKVIPRLEQILRTELKVPIRLRLTQADREVVVVGGSTNRSRARIDRPMRSICTPFPSTRTVGRGAAAAPSTSSSWRPAPTSAAAS
jgi:hypothetical protein